MNPTLTITRREWREWARDGRLLAAGLFVALALCAALVAGQARQSELEAQQQAAMQDSYANWLGQEAKNPHSAVHHGMYLFAPVPPLHVLDPGITPYVGRSLLIQAHRQNDFQFRPAADATGLQRFGVFSPASVLQTLLPLLLILLGYNAVSGERERGTLRQLLAQGLAPVTLLRGKALALGSVAGLSLLLTLPVTGWLLLREPDAAHRLDAGLRALALLGGYGVFLAATVAVVLAVSASARNSRRALLWLLGLWMLNAVFLPRAAASLAERLHPTPSSYAFNAALFQELFAGIAKMREEKFGASRWTDVPAERFGDSLIEGQVVEVAVYGKHFRALRERFEQQQGVQRLTAIAAPLVALRLYSMALAGSDLAHHRHFADAAEAYRQSLEYRISLDALGRKDGYNYHADPALWATVAPFTLDEREVAAALRDEWLSLAALVLLLGGSLFWLARATRALARG